LSSTRSTRAHLVGCVADDNGCCAAPAAAAATADDDAGWRQTAVALRPTYKLAPAASRSIMRH